MITKPAATPSHLAHPLTAFRRQITPPRSKESFLDSTYILVMQLDKETSLSKRQSRTRNERRSRLRSKKFDISIAERTLRNVESLTCDGVSEPWVHTFLTQIEKVSTYAQTTRDTITRPCLELRQNRSKFETFDHIFNRLSCAPLNDVILLEDSDSLGQSLRQDFRSPLLHQARPKNPSLGCHMNFSIRDLLDHLAEDERATCSVYDCSIPDPGKRTYTTPITTLQSCFQQNSHQSNPLNFLDIENRTNIQFCPFQITMQDILTRIGAQQARDKGKTQSTWEHPVQKEFFILSMPNVVSTIHVDSGGANTWVLLLVGRKIWYFSKDRTAQTVRWLGHGGAAQPLYYEGGWAKVELRAGDLL